MIVSLCNLTGSAAVCWWQAQQQCAETPLKLTSDWNVLNTGIHHPYHPWKQDSWGQHGAYLGPTGPRWAPCRSHEPCYLGWFGETGARWEMGQVGHMAISRNPLIWWLCLKVMIISHTTTLLCIKNHACCTILMKMLGSFVNTKQKSSFLHFDLTSHFVQVALKLLKVVIPVQEIWSSRSSSGVSFHKMPPYGTRNVGKYI